MLLLHWGLPVGSSPLARGKQLARAARAVQNGLIPARAGKTTGAESTCKGTSAHPRSRGENVNPSALEPVTLGSSPLARGKQSHVHTLKGRIGLIPACAGKTPWCRGRRSNPKAHPRLRGENGKAPQAERKSSGSSPLARGKQVSPQEAHQVGRLIPACAGKTSLPQRLADRCAAHPRLRGENATLRP